MLPFKYSRMGRNLPRMEQIRTIQAGAFTRVIQDRGNLLPHLAA